MSAILSIFALITMTELIQDPSLYKGKEEVISGFAYQGETGEWVLSSEPNLRSCCVGSKSKRARQVIIEGELPNLKNSSLVQVRGKIIQNKEGLILQNPEVMKQTKGSLPLWPIALAFLGFGVVLIRRR